MNYKRLMNYLRIIPILCLLIQFYAIGQTDSTDYQNFSKDPLTITELQLIARILPQAESYYHQNKNKDIVLAGKDTIISNLTNAIEKSKDIMNLYEERLKLKDLEIEAIKPKWWQKEEIILIEIIVGIITGVIISK